MVNYIAAPAITLATMCIELAQHEIINFTETYSVCLFCEWAVSDIKLLINFPVSFSSEVQSFPFHFRYRSAMSNLAVYSSCVLNVMECSFCRLGLPVCSFCRLNPTVCSSCVVCPRREPSPVGRWRHGRVGRRELGRVVRPAASSALSDDARRRNGRHRPTSSLTFGRPRDDIWSGRRAGADGRTTERDWRAKSLTAGCGATEISRC